MGKSKGIALSLISALALTACAQQASEADVERALATVNALDENNLSSIMLQSADPQEAVNYFKRSLAQEPDRFELTLFPLRPEQIAEG